MGRERYVLKNMFQFCCFVFGRKMGGENSLIGKGEEKKVVFVDCIKLRQKRGAIHSNVTQ